MVFELSEPCQGRRRPPARSARSGSGPTKATPMEKETDWWGEWVFEVGDARRWRIGPTTLWIERRAREWVIDRVTEPDPFSEALEVASPGGADDRPVDRVTVLRLAGDRASGGGLRLVPKLADRQVIARPEMPFRVLPEQSTTVYVGSPVWLALEAVPEGSPIDEFPLFRPSDTWFGPNTREGDLCYATRTRCRMDPNELRWNPHRAVTQVTIRNPHPNPLPVHRINLPVSLLSLCSTRPGRLVTPPITYTRRGSDEAIAELEIGSPPNGAAIVSGPRMPSPTHRLVRAFSRFL